MPTLTGVKIVISVNIPEVPVLQISPSFEWCTDAYRAKHNAWLLERFGTYEPAYRLGSGELVMSRKLLEQMKQQLQPYQSNFLQHLR